MSISDNNIFKNECEQKSNIVVKFEIYKCKIFEIYNI